MTSRTQVDLLVIGAGPAGLAAGQMFSRLKRTCLIYDSGVYRNDVSDHAHAVAGFEGVNPAEIRRKYRQDIIEFYGDTTTFKQGKITTLNKVGEVFEAKDENGNEVVARKVILATGLKDKLPDIPGIADQWGKRAIHCIFCHGTETANKPFAFLFTAPNAWINPGLAGTMLKLWPSLKHDPVYVLTHGQDVNTAEGRKGAGLEAYWDIVQKKGYTIISSPITSVKSDADNTTLTITFQEHSSIQVPYMLLFPEKCTPNDHALPFVNEQLFGLPLGPMGTIPFDPASQGSGGGGGMPRMGDSPKTPVKGLFWAGNSGAPAGNVAISVAQGQMAGAVAGDELGDEDLAKL
ncbi:hypothetical protein L202_04703 [Cryptococcus amylolentus CBS 6039]|uniref:FAD/NAD(P)-binding domain-containing protein n=2 Tax=Cryptococcus amylolentus TaxID=104669 RepID=A0A1E3HMF9_9TREE|nr:hypothetical protein L202_04703 [Cryptococcus amylolentus CBS 6039]ODN77530.1 hypothetical protein L202_04703 [Cryptococcus amylolentus CBS 6039]ODO05573.1 hypothetical protein I350_04629 [Cryptococcus amylolentus CBS 6273]